MTKVFKGIISIATVRNTILRGKELGFFDYAPDRIPATIGTKEFVVLLGQDWLEGLAKELNINYAPESKGRVHVLDAQIDKRYGYAQRIRMVEELINREMDIAIEI